MEKYTISVDSNIYQAMLDQTISELILINDFVVKKYQVENQITIQNVEDNNQFFTAKITNLYYFETVMDALVTIDKKKLGFSNRKPLTQIEDALLAKLKPENVQKYGVVVVEFKII